MTTVNELLNPNIDYGIVGQVEAKQALEDNLRLRAAKDQPQKIILLEGYPGTGKSTLIDGACKKYIDKCPDRFAYYHLGISDLTVHVSTTSKKISELWQKFKDDKRSKIVVIDEADEVMQTRKTTGNIRNERTTSIILKLGENMPNLLIILATNRPKMIDGAILDRCEERINCSLPTDHELRKIIDMHIPFIDDSLKDVLHNWLINTTQTKKDKEVKVFFNGRDIKSLSDKLKTKLELKELDNLEPKISPEDICLAYEQLRHGKYALKEDYLD